MKKKVFVTTSWDDGHNLDLKLADVLEKYALKGTFYVPKSKAADALRPEDRKLLEEKGVKMSPLSEDDIRQLDKKHEVGAHTLTHPHLTKITSAEAEKEIVGSKTYTEGITGRETKMFCYPYGEYSSRVKELVKSAGFVGARTVEMGVTAYPNDPMAFATTSQAFPRPVKIRLHKAYAFPQRWIFTWESQIRRRFNRVRRNGGVFHIWGHSWEIDKLELWDRLEKVFEEISGQRNVEYVTNGECLEALGFEKKSLQFAVGDSKLP